MFSSPLRRALARGMKPGGDLVKELRQLDDYEIRSRKDALAICQSLAALPPNQDDSDRFNSPLPALASLFQDVAGRDTPAFAVLYEQGLPQLARIVAKRLPSAGDDQARSLLLVLKILAMYGSREGAEVIVNAARKPLKPDDYLWHVILSAFSSGHPHRDYVFKALSDPLPPEFIAVSLLDVANRAALEGEIQQHPFDSPSGWERLQSWLAGSDPETFSYAHSATAALPFLSNPARDQLLALAMDHTDTTVQMEAAWAAGKLGREAGLKMLARFSLDINHSDVAQRYLAELQREDLIPAEALEPSFRAKAEFAQWLAHPNELGKPADEIELVDHRYLAWPPDRKPLPFWVFRYRLRDRTGLKHDDVDCGLVGSMTWCFFSYKMNERPPEDVYAIHCYWEMEHAKLIEQSEVTNPAEYSAMLQHWKGDRLVSPTIILIAEVSAKLKTAARLVALATAIIGGDEGWVVLDGPRSKWYPKAEQPSECHQSVILKIHIGRLLLGFEESPDRQKYLLGERPRRDPLQIIAAYEKLIDDLATADTSRQKELWGSMSLLENHFNDYVSAVVETRGQSSRQKIMAEVYERFLQIASSLENDLRVKAYDSFSVLGSHLADYVDALVALQRTEEIIAMIEIFAPQWNHNLGYGTLGTAAFKAGQAEQAEEYFLKLRHAMEHYYRSESMSMLAEIWHRRGDTTQSAELLMDCMQQLLKAIEASKYNSDRQTYAEEFRHHRATYLRLFATGESELTKLGIPEHPL